MRLITLLALSGLLSAAPALAQETDTLDFRGYFPLSVGNVWEYSVYLSRPQSPYREEDESRTEHVRLSVVAESYGPGGEWFALVEDRSTVDGATVSHDTVAVRYREATGDDPARVVALRRRNDGQPHELPYSFFAYILDAPYNGAPQYLPPFLESLDSLRVKTVETMVFTYTLAHGVGFVGGSGGCEPCDSFSDSETWTLTYALVDGEAYGAGLDAAEGPGESASQSQLALYPNPTRGEITVRSTFDHLGPVLVEVFDVRGRRVMSAPLPPSGLGTMDLSAQPPGLYLIRAGGQTERVVLQ